MSVSPLSRGPRTPTAWGVSASTVRRAIDERRIPAMRLTVGGSIRIPADATPPVD